MLTGSGYFTGRKLFPGWRLIAAGALILLLWFTAAPMVSILIICLILSYFVAEKLFQAKVVDSRFFTFALALVIFVSLLQVMPYAGFAVSSSLPLTSVMPLTGLMLVVLLCVLVQQPGGDAVEVKSRRSLVGAKDVLSVVATLLVIFCTAILPVVNNQGGFGKESNLLVLTNVGVDDASHINIFNDRIDANKAVMVHSSLTGFRSPSAIDYPSGWHSANGAILLAISQDAEPGIDTLRFYIYSKIFWFALVVFVLCRSAMSLLRATKEDEPGLVANLSVALLGALVSFYIFQNSFLEGHFSFIPILLAVPVFILSILQLTSASGAVYKYLFIPILLLTMSSLSWTLLFPVFGLSIAVAVIAAYGGKVSRSSFKKSFKIPTILLTLIYCILVAVALMGIQRVSGSGAGGTLISSLLVDGGIARWPVTFMYLLVGSMGIFYLLCAKGLIATPVSRTMINVIFSSAFLTAFIYAVQQYNLGYTAYYYHKALLILIECLVVVMVVTIAVCASQMRRLFGGMHSTLLVLSVFFIFTQVLVDNPTSYQYMNGKRDIGSAVTERIWTDLKAHHTQAAYDEKKLTVFFTDNSHLNEVSNWLLKSNKPLTGCFREWLHLGIFSRPDKFDLSLAEESCAETDEITLYVQSSHMEKIKQKVSRSSMSAKVVMVAYE